MNHMRAFLLITTFISIASCGYFEVNDASNSGRFMPETYFSKEAETLSEKDLILIKTVIKNGTKETITTDSVDWFMELKPFISINIAKPAQINSYRIDSILESGLLKVNYTARDSSVNIKQMNITFKNEELTGFRAIQSSKNLYYQSVDTMEYYTGGNYRISAMSKPRLGKEVKFELSGKVLEQEKKL